MYERTFRLKYITSKNCFVYLSDKLSKLVKQGSVVKLSFEDRTSLNFSIGPHFSGLAEDDLALSSIYARTLQLGEGNYVVLTSCNPPPGIKCLDLALNKKDDFEILESMADIIQQTLLDQIRIVNDKQKIVVWITPYLHVTASIENIKPTSPGRLDEFTEVIVKPPSSETKQFKKINSKSSWNIKSFLQYFNPPETPKANIFEKYSNLWPPLIFRLQLVDGIKDKIPDFQEGAVFKVYTSPVVNHLRNEVALLRVIPIFGDHNFFDETKPEMESIAVQVCLVKNLPASCFIPLFVNKHIFDHFNIKIGTKVILDDFKVDDNVSSIEVGTNKKYSDNIIGKFKEFLAQNCKADDKFLLNSNFWFNLTGDCRIILKFVPMNIKACLVGSDFLRNCTFTNFECDLPANVSNLKKPANICSEYANFKNIFNDCMQCWNLYLTGLISEYQNILIAGKPGTGKSTLTNCFADAIASQNYVHIETVACKSIKGKSLDSLHKLFTSVFSRLIYYQPSLLILDDLHILCEKVTEGDAPTQESIHFNKVSELLSSLLEQHLQNNSIFLLATTESTVKLNLQIFAPRGRNLFKNVFTIDELKKTDRKTILRYLFKQKETELDEVNVEELVIKTDGFVVQDLVDFVDKCVFEAFKEESLQITPVHCENALRNTPSLALRNVKLHASGDRDFSDIGGLEDVKKTLVESMLWPAQYSNIFAKAPLRLQSGLLLYGPPGTGKTILAGAAAKQCGLRLISIKGPELLSKYIGASEQAVRDVFQKAQSAKPCILFFDEFDSLAPRRGHDNTGVTDRVVNQFLTQLDGVESLVGVCVLAATSRPDLLDPALLRPGRLDRQILCPLPDKVARLSILKSLSKNLTLDCDVNLEKIAVETDGFSGADLQAVLYTAQLSSVENLLDEEAASDSNDGKPCINQKFLEEAMKNTRPSLTYEEKRRYDGIYAKFEKRGDIDDIIKGKQRATLA